MDWNENKNLWENDKTVAINLEIDSTSSELLKQKIYMEKHNIHVKNEIHLGLSIRIILFMEKSLMIMMRLGK